MFKALAKRKTLLWATALGMSFMYIMNNSGPRILPWGLREIGPISNISQKPRP